MIDYQLGFLQSVTADSAEETVSYFTVTTFCADATVCLLRDSLALDLKELNVQELCLQSGSETDKHKYK